MLRYTAELNTSGGLSRTNVVPKPSGVTDGRRSDKRPLRVGRSGDTEVSVAAVWQSGPAILRTKYGPSPRSGRGRPDRRPRPVQSGFSLRFSPRSIDDTGTNESSAAPKFLSSPQPCASASRGTQKHAEPAEGSDENCSARTSYH